MSSIHIITSRFNNSTWSENCIFRERHNYKGCIYGSPQQITEKIPQHSLIFVIEMNNSTNKIEGIGLIRNVTRHDKKLGVYEAGNYNRYTYIGKYRVDRSTLEQTNPQILQIIEQILFKGKTHLKRGGGFTRIPEKLYKHHRIEELYSYTELQIKEELAALFKRRFSESGDFAMT